MERKEEDEVYLINVMARGGVDGWEPEDETPGGGDGRTEGGADVNKYNDDYDDQCDGIGDDGGGDVSGYYNGYPQE